MNARRIYAVVQRHLYETRRNFDRWIDIIYWPILDILIWGFLTIYLSRSADIGPNVRNFLLGGVILWGIFHTFMLHFTVGFLDELWARNLLNLFTSPLSIWEYITGLLVLNVFKIVAGFLVAALLALALYGFNIFNFSLALLPYFLNLLLFGLALGFFVTALIFRYSTKIQALAWSFAGALSPVSAVFYPLSTLPKFLQTISWFLPTTHSFEGMRQVLAGGGFSTVHFGWGIGLNLAYLILATLFLKYIFEIARKRGLLVKME